MLILVAQHSLLVSGAYTAVCCNTGQLNYQVTKDCCTAVANGQKGWTAAQQHFEEASHNCISNNLGGGNSVNDGDVAACCKSRDVLVLLHLVDHLEVMPGLVANYVVWHLIFNPDVSQLARQFLLCAVA